MKRFLQVTSCWVLTAFAAFASSLVQNSPFLPQGYNKEEAETATPAPQPLPDGRFVLKGIAILGGKYYFSITDSISETSQWIAEDETINGFAVTSFDPTRFRAAYSWNGADGFMRFDGSANIGSAPAGRPRGNSTGPAFANTRGSNPSQVAGGVSSRHSANTPTAANYTAPEIIHFQQTPASRSDDYLVGIYNSGNPFAQNDRSRGSPQDLGRIGDLNVRPAVIQNNSAPPIPSSRINRITNPSGKVPTHLL